MNKIKANIRISELDTLSNTLIRLYRAACAEGNSLSKDGNLESMMVEVEKIAAEISGVVHRGRVASSLDEADVDRDRIVRNLSKALEGYASIPISEKSSAADRLLAIFQRYGRGIAVKNYAEESSLVESLLGDFSSDAAKADAQKLEGIPELLDALRASQDAFHAANDAFTAAKTGRGENASLIKKRLLSVLNGRLIPYLKAVVFAEECANYIGKFEMEVNRANAIVSARENSAPVKSAETSES